MTLSTSEVHLTSWSVGRTGSGFASQWIAPLSSPPPVLFVFRRWLTGWAAHRDGDGELQMDLNIAFIGNLE